MNAAKTVSIMVAQNGFWTSVSCFPDPHVPTHNVHKHLREVLIQVCTELAPHDSQSGLIEQYLRSLPDAY